MPTELLKARQVAERLGVCLRTVWRWTATGQLPPPFRLGRVTRWKKDDIDACVNALRRHRTGASEPGTRLSEPGA